MNGRIVPLTYRLRSGDRVEILTAKEANPHRDWLLRANGFLASRRSRDKVRAWFNKIERARNVQVGKESLERGSNGWDNSTWILVYRAAFPCR